jgi:hypothetical protein
LVLLSAKRILAIVESQPSEGIRVARSSADDPVETFPPGAWEYRTDGADTDWEVMVLELQARETSD